MVRINNELKKVVFHLIFYPKKRSRNPNSLKNSKKIQKLENNQKFQVFWKMAKSPNNLENSQRSKS